MAGAFEPVQHKRVYEEVVDVLVSKIQSGELEVDDKLPPERILCEELQVSRSTIRLALKAMESMGYLRSIVGGGHYVNKVSLENIITPFYNMMSQDKELAADIIEVRKYMETHMASLAAKQATKEELARIYGAILNMQAEISTGGFGIKGDSQFHLEIARASHNKAFVIIVELIAELLDDSRRATLEIPGQPDKAVDDHMKIFEAIRDQDPERAEKEMLAHLTKAHKNVITRR